MFPWCAELDLGVASAGIEGTLLGQVSASWNDTSGTGKFRLPAIENFIEHNDAECIVTLNADVRGIVDLVYSVGVGIASYSGKVQLFNQVLWSVSTGPCPDTETAHVSSGGEALPASDAFPNGETSTPGELIVNAGPFAHLRESGATDTDENFIVMQLCARRLRGQWHGVEQHLWRRKLHLL